MAMVKKSITVTTQQEEWIQAQIATGNYASDSELFRALIRQEQERNAQIDAIRTELLKAENRGFTDRTPDEILAAVIERKRAHGQL